MESAHRTPYSSVANVYDAFLTLTGFKRGVEHFLDRVALDLPSHAKVLDAGCGTGLVALYLARRFPDAEIYACDIDESMLREMTRIMAAESIAGNVVPTVGNLTQPSSLRRLEDRSALSIPDGSLDAVTVSGALEHAPLEPAVAALARLLKPGGVFFNLWVRRNPMGAVLAMVYRFRPYTIAEMRRACEQAGLRDIRVLRLGVEDFPANLSRIAIMAKKTASST